MFRSVSNPIKSLYTIDDETLVRYQKYKEGQDPAYNIDASTAAKPFVFSLSKAVHLSDNK